MIKVPYIDSFLYFRITETLHKGTNKTKLKYWCYFSQSERETTIDNELITNSNGK